MKFTLCLVSVITSIVLFSCQKCEDCTLTTTSTVNGSPINTTATINEYCGSELDDIKANSTYKKNGTTYKWTCE